MSGTVVDALTHWARVRPELTAIDFAGDTITYAELASWADGVAALLTEQGVTAGDRVSILGQNSLEWCAAALGAFTVGAIVAPFNQRMVARELGDLVDDCEPRVVFCANEFVGRLDEVLASGREFGVVVLEDAVAPLRGAVHADVRPAVVDLASPTAIVFTSGTTGKPKGVIFTHASIAGVMHDWTLMESVQPNELRPLLVLPLFSAAGIIWGISRTIFGGGTLFLQPSFDPAQALRVLIEDKANTFTGPPILFEQIAKLPGFDDAELSHLTTAHVGGARVPMDLLARWATRGVALRQLYGQTEIGGSATVTVLADAASHPDKCGWGTVFTKIRVVDAEGVDCPPGTAGEILLRGPGMTPGYWRNPEATAAAFTDDGWLRTGDLGSLDADGRLTFIDRLKELIISGGLNISPAEIESVIGAIDGVDEVAVIAMADEKFGETPAAVVTVSGDLTLAQVVEHCATQLADYKVPRYVVVSSTPLPRMASGKINKRELRTEYAEASLHRVR